MVFVNLTINFCNYNESMAYQDLSKNNGCNVVAVINN